MSNKKPTIAAEMAKVLADAPSLSPAKTSTNAAMVTENEEGEATGDTGGGVNLATCTRDAGVSDAVWEQLQKDKEKEAQDDEELRRLKRAQRNAKDADRERIVREILAKEEERKKIEAKKKKLMSLGVCPAGYQWIKQSGGYRCAGGSHWMSDDMVDKV
jgi:hypothetical protein